MNFAPNFAPTDAFKRIGAIKELQGQKTIGPVVTGLVFEDENKNTNGDEGL